VELTTAHGGRAEAGSWDRVRPHSLGSVTARAGDGTLVGFVNVASDGGITRCCSIRRRTASTSAGASGRAWSASPRSMRERPAASGSTWTSWPSSRPSPRRVRVPAGRDRTHPAPSLGDP
jgi:hypothetical protein